MSRSQQIAAFAALLLIALVVTLRVVVSEAQTNALSPLLYVSFVIIILAGVWLLARSIRADPMPVSAVVSGTQG